MATAATKVFGLPELLERILDSATLDIKDIFTFERVNSTFRFTIKDSPALRRKQYLVCSPPSSDGSAPSGWNPMLKDLVVGRFHLDITYPEAAKGWTLHMSLITRDYTDFVHPYLINKDEDRGLACTAHGRRHFHDVKGSWSRTLVSDEVVPITLIAEVRVLVEQLHYGFDDEVSPIFLGCDNYEELVAWQTYNEAKRYEQKFVCEAEKATLGWVYGVLDEVARRSEGEHWSLALAYKKTLNG